ncbi:MULTISPECIES: ribonuclease domain-containing protein [unclassified Streptomyces]|jgi:ribonuclease T1|uniref:ribonuclease domain-containing protein n=1 Tax=unclassified Streptomyces TaxID=2593676 RepID=UPI00369D0A30
MVVRQVVRGGIALLAGVVLLLGGCAGGETGRDTPPSPRPSPAASRSDGAALPAVRVADLPPEARRTLELIERGGPFPYARDGAVFSNFERRLPRRPGGYYREYTVPTPGERDRGARRIVTGRGGETYYTDDHYESFREVAGP